MNGLLIGVVAFSCLRSGLGLSLFSFIAPHGSLELPSLFIAGGAGFLLGRGVLFPGRLSRRGPVSSSSSSRSGRLSQILIE